MDGMPEAFEFASRDRVLTMPRLRSTREAAFSCVLAAMSLACSAGLLVAAVLEHPPVGIVPLLAIACIGCPVYGTWELPPALVVLRARRTNRRQTIDRFRRALRELPEIDHPLGR